MNAPRPLWFGADRGELFGMYHAPAAISGKLGVVLCNPFGYEAMCTHRAYRHLAERLAAQGFPVLRFDYHGTGDSSGNDRDPQRWTAWQDSVGRAIDELKRRSGCVQIGLVGLRLGANLALLAAQSRDDVLALALWGPFFTGKAFVREELAVHKLRALTTKVDVVGAPNDEVEALGFLLRADTHAALQAHTLADLHALSARSALVLTRETALQESRVAARLQELGVAVQCENANGYASMLRDSEPPQAVWTRIVDYFTATQAELVSAPSHAPLSGQDVSSARHAVWDSVSSESPVEETAVFFGPQKRLFGVISHSHGHTRPRIEPAPAVLLLSGGFNPHVGQNRMFTRWARSWAALGLTCLRFDLGGLGESRAADGEPEGQLHSLGSIADLQAAMDHLAAVSGSQHFAIVGLCSGAFIGFHAALADRRITSLAMLNWTRFYPSGARVTVRGRYRSLRFYLSALGARSTWQKLLRGRVDALGITKHLLSVTLRRVRASLTPGSSDATARLARDMGELAARGVKSLIVYNGDETAIDELHEQLGPDERRLRTLGLLRLEILDGTDHIFTPTWSQERLAVLLTEHLVQVDSMRPPAAFANEVALG